MTRVFLGTVALEPNRWGTIRADRSPELDLGSWIDRLATLDIDGLEVWDGHVIHLDDAGVDALADGPLGIAILNSYVGFDDPDPTARDSAAALARRLDARGVKFNVGNDPTAIDAYAERLAAWVADLPSTTAAICECHQGISIAEEPAVAAAILTAAGAADRVQALVHTHDDQGLLAAKFDALGERITHVHVNHLDFDAMRHPPLAEIEDGLGAAVRQIRSYGFAGTWTLEFVAGLLTERDNPDQLFEQAQDDLAVLHRVLETT